MREWNESMYVLLLPNSHYVLVVIGHAVYIIYVLYFTFTCSVSDEYMCTCTRTIMLVWHLDFNAFPPSCRKKYDFRGLSRIFPDPPPSLEDEGPSTRLAIPMWAGYNTPPNYDSLIIH